LVTLSGIVLVVSSVCSSFISRAWATTVTTLVIIVSVCAGAKTLKLAGPATWVGPAQVVLLLLVLLLLLLLLHLLAAAAAPAGCCCCWWLLLLLQAWLSGGCRRAQGSAERGRCGRPAAAG